MRILLAVLSNALIGLLLWTEPSRAVESSAAGDKAFREVVGTAKAGDDTGAWIRTEAVAVAVARRDWPAADSLFRALHRHKDLETLRDIGHVIAATARDDEIVPLLRQVETWEHVAKHEGLAGEASEAAVRSLIDRGRFGAARKVVGEMKLEYPAAIILADGRWEEAAHAYGHFGLDQAVEEASSFIRAGGTPDIPAFVRSGWPEYETNFGVKLCLSVAVGGGDPKDLLPLCQGELRRKVLENACKEMSQWDERYSVAFKEMDIYSNAEILQERQSLDMGRLLCACRFQHRPIPQVAQAQLEWLLTHKERFDAIRFNRRLAAVEQLVLYRIEFDDHEQLKRDLRKLGTAISSPSILACVADACAHVADCERTFQFAEHLDDQNLKTAIQIGGLKRQLGLVPQRTKLEKEILDSRMQGLYMFIMDPLHDD